MKFRTAVGAALLGSLIGWSPASAFDQPGEMTGGTKTAKYETEFGRALPPIGYVNFCGRNPQGCEKAGDYRGNAAMSPDRWNLLNQVNAFVNGKVAPVSDQDLYGQPEYWAYPTDAGDCEDYVLLKQRMLENIGFPSSALLITVVLDEKQEGHAVLTVATDQGDYVLDNRRDDVLRWSDTAYTFLKRQSKADPKVWVALAKDKTLNAKLTSGKVAQ